MPVASVCALCFAAVSAVQEAAPSGPPEEVVVVTGERVSRSLRETASSVSVFTADMIESSPGVDRLDQILELVPNVTLGNGGRGPTIRGQDTTGSLQDLPAFLGGNRPRVTLQVDGRAVGFNEFVFGVAPIWDVRQVEVFRSPQSTTQGRNSIAGAIFVTTKDPTYRWEVGARAIAANFDGRQLSGVVSGPLVADQVAVRLAGDLRRARTSTRIADRMPGANPNEDNYSLIRFKLLAEPGALPGARLELSFNHNESGNPGQVVRAPFGERRDPFPLYGVFRTNIDAVTGSLGLDLHDQVRLVTTLSRGDSFIERFPPPGLGRTDTKLRDFSIESLISWKPGEQLGLTGGVHYLASRLHQLIDLTAVVGLGEFNDRQASLGLFGEATVRPVPRLSVTAGLRYQSDRQRRHGQLGTEAFLLPIDFDETYRAWLPKLTVAYDLTDKVTAGLLVQRAYNPGGTTLNFDTGDQVNFGPESLWAYELFARAALADDRLRLSANLFYTDFRDAQRSRFHAFSVPGGGTAFWAEIDNVPASESYGLEASADWRFNGRLRARAGVGLLKTRIREAVADNPSLKNNEFSRSPTFTGSASIDWQPLTRLRLTGTGRHNSRYFSDDANLLALRIGRATRIDARAAYDVGPATIFAYGRNLLDDFNMTFLTSPTSGVAAEPREVGIGLEARF